MKNFFYSPLTGLFHDDLLGSTWAASIWYAYGGYLPNGFISWNGGRLGTLG